MNSHRIDNSSRLSNIEGDFAINGALAVTGDVIVNKGSAGEFKLPNTIGVSGQMPILNSSGRLEWGTPSSGISNQITNVDGTSHVTSVAAGTSDNVDITCDGVLTAKFLPDLLELYGQTAAPVLRLHQLDNLAYVGLRAPATGVTNYTLTLPTDAGMADHVLATDGTGVTTWSALPKFRGEWDNTTQYMVGDSAVVSTSATPQHMYDTFQYNTNPEGSTGPTELGAEVNFLSAGTVTALRFFMTTTNPPAGGYTLNFWTTSSLLASVTRPVGELVPGWNTVSLPSPVSVSTGISYAVSYGSQGKSFPQRINPTYAQFQFNTASSIAPVRVWYNSQGSNPMSGTTNADEFFADVEFVPVGMLAIEYIATAAPTVGVVPALGAPWVPTLTAFADQGTSFLNILGTYVSQTDAQTLTNKTITDSSNTVSASRLRTTGADVVVSAAAVPTAGQALVATSGTAAAWMNRNTGVTQTISTTGTIADDAEFVLYDGQTSANITTPAAAAGRRFYIVCPDSGALLVTNTRIYPPGSGGTFVSNLSLNQKQLYSLISDGADWYSLV